MEEIFHIVKNVTIFVLLFSVVSNLFSQSKYRQYFDFIQGIVILILVMTPLFSTFLDGEFLDECLRKNMSAVQEKSYEDELKLIGEQRERMIEDILREGGGQEPDE